MRSSLKRLAVAALLAGSLGLANATTIHVILTGMHEVPPIRTAAQGTAVITVQADGRVRGEVHIHGMTATMVHIHEGATDANGPILIWLKRHAHGVWVVPPGAKLTPAQYKHFRAGDLYINVHSSRYPSGEIRGQLIP